MTSTTIRISTELRDRLARLARDDDLSMGSVIERALDRQLEEMFWARARLTMAASLDRAQIRSETEALAGTVRDGLVEESWAEQW